MKAISLVLVLSLISILNFAQARTIHVMVSLCDNEHQGIVPVPKAIGNGQDPNRNLYWGAGYGVKNFFDRKTTDWTLVATFPSDNPVVLKRILFKHTTHNAYLLADAYDGEFIKNCNEDFLKSANNQLPIEIKHNGQTLYFGGKSDLLAYIGHDGLMDFNVDIAYNNEVAKTIDVMILACMSRDYYSPEIRNAKANPILWTTHLMAPEAYTLKDAIDGWLLNETGEQIEERAAQAYNKYQKCGIRGARNLFTTGF